MNHVLGLIDMGLQEQCEKTFQRWVQQHSLDPIEAQRMLQGYVAGFKAAMSMQPTLDGKSTTCLPVTPDQVHDLSRLFLRYIMVTARAGNIAPFDAMAALVMCITTIGRQVQPTFTHAQVFETMTREATSILHYMDNRDSSDGQVTH